jgi:hypothetical protein
MGEKMEAADSSEILVIIYKAPSCDNSEGHNLNFHSSEYAKSHQMIDEFV